MVILMNNILRGHFFNLFKNNIDIYPALRIAITYRCDNGCSYCFLKNLDNDLVKDMELMDFSKIIQWLIAQKKKKILITGGEPFMHRDIIKILNVCRKNNILVGILTNGLLINKEVKSWIKTKNIFLILNINGSYGTVQKNIEGIEDKVCMLRYNLIKDNLDYNILFDMAKNYSVPVRFGFTVPSIFGNNECYSLEDMRSYKFKIFDFIDAALLKKVKVHMARPLPRCIFSKNEWKYLQKKFGAKDKCLVGQKGNYACRAIVNPDMSVYVCYGSFLNAPSIWSFKNIKELSNYFKDDFKKIRERALIDECHDCSYFKNYSCQGGCLVYKYVNR